MNITILAAGTWGTALAKVLSKNHSVTVWSISDIEASELNALRMHKNLPGMKIPKNIIFTSNLRQAVFNTEIIIIATPSVFVRSTVEKIKPIISSKQIIVCVAKGIESGTLYTMSEVINDVLDYDNPVVALSGPTHAEEVAMDIPTLIVSSSTNYEAAKIVQRLFVGTCIRPYTNGDIKGIELCGALKNIIALACGIAIGLGYGDNTTAAIMTRGMSEIRNLGRAIGCFEETFSGLAEMGDLVVTATSQHSRNNRAGQLIGQGLSAAEAKEKVGMVVEGINALPAAIELSEKYNVELPIINAVNDVVTGRMLVKDAVIALLGRDAHSELTKTESDLQYENVLLNQRRNVSMKRVITYGTFDLLHYGHINLLRRAKALGDYLIVVVSSDEFNWNEKHKKTYFTYEQRKQLLEAIRYVDLVIPEENWQQKRSDMHEYHIDTFVMGDDWKGKFDFLREEGVEVVYFPRTPEISSSQIKKDLYDANSVDGESKTSHDEINTDPN